VARPESRLRALVLVGRCRERESESVFLQLSPRSTRSWARSLLCRAIVKALTTLASFSLLSLFLASGCTADIIGTGSDGEQRPQQPVANNSGVGEFGKPGGGLGPQPPPALAASGVPVEIDALFHTPAAATVTDDQLFGVWALTGSAAGGETERRMKFAANELVIAERCREDGAIVYVSVQVRATNQRVMILESKQVERSPYEAPYGKCRMAVSTVVQEWPSCDAVNSAVCYSLKGDQLSLHGGSWLKLSD
jgi:hypothetical protein